jgi:phenazine biosynthesis protein phzE
MKPSALIEKDGIVTHYQGIFHTLSTLDEVEALSKRSKNPLVFLNPFRTIRERGYEAHGEEPILVLEATEVIKTTREAVMNAIQDVPVEIEKAPQPSISNSEFEENVRRIQTDEIAAGNACQVIYSRRFEGKIGNMSPEVLLSIYKNLLKQRGQYMTLLFTDGHDRNFVAATPEQHLGIQGDSVSMTPIAGTIRKVDRNNPKETFEEQKRRLIEFLRDPKEIKELFHVLDEELKMMARNCPKGGRIEGPFLRQNGAVIHTEYRLIGQDGMQTAIQSFRHTLHAPTLVGGPEKSAASIIKKYEKDSRRYYGGEIVVMEPDGTFDSAIMIRAAEIHANGDFAIQAGGGIVADSIPEGESEESRLKAGGTLGAITSSLHEAPDVSDLLKDPEVQAALKERNEFLSRFLFENQSDLMPEPALQGKRITIINNEDDFAYMIGHMARHMGCEVEVVEAGQFDPSDLAEDQLVIVGPGPRDINDEKDLHMKKLVEDVALMRARGVPLLGICLGHQALAKAVGMPVEKQDKPTQGEQREVTLLDGQSHKLGFYNSFSPTQKNLPEDFKAACDEKGRIIEMRGPKTIGVQFHPESVMSQNGYALLRDYLIELTKGKK